MRRKVLIAISIGIIILAAFLYFKKAKSSTTEQIVVPVKKGLFEVIITTTGELQAKNSENVMGPSTLRNAGVWQVKISDLIPEGTVVKAGEYIATLDRAEVSGKLKELEGELQKNESQYMQTKLDTTLQMRNTRDELVNLKYALEEKKIILDQSKFEPPAVVRQAEIDLEKAKRAYAQALENYKIKTDQLSAKMQEVSATLSIQKNKHSQMVTLLDQFVINAPKDGMVIYVKEWSGKKKAVGSTISPWEPAVATLPDLSVMITQTYVNEVDISKVKIGQEVKIGVDAFPGKNYSGKIISVANVGEQRPNSDAKVFEVKVQLNKSDSILRPSMTTSNAILASSLKNVLFLPLESIHSSEGVSYVFLKEGFKWKKKEVRTGATNSNEIVIEKGLNEGDNVCLTIPENTEDMEIERLPKQDKKIAKL